MEEIHTKLHCIFAQQIFHYLKRAMHSFGEDMGVQDTQLVMRIRRGGTVIWVCLRKALKTIFYYPSNSDVRYLPAFEQLEMCAMICVHRGTHNTTDHDTEE